MFVLLANHLRKNEANAVLTPVQVEAHPPGESQHTLTLAIYTAGAPITQLLCSDLCSINSNRSLSGKCKD